MPAITSVSNKPSKYAGCRGLVHFFSVFPLAKQQPACLCAPSHRPNLSKRRLFGGLVIYGLQRYCFCGNTAPFFCAEKNSSFSPLYVSRIDRGRFSHLCNRTRRVKTVMHPKWLPYYNRCNITALLFHIFHQ